MRPLWEVQLVRSGLANGTLGSHVNPSVPNTGGGYRFLVNTHGFATHRNPTFNRQLFGSHIRLFLNQHLHEQKAVTLARRAFAKRYQVLYDNAPNLLASVDAVMGNIRECNKTLSLGWDEQWCGNILWA
jgi:hypothetical protein